MRNNQKMREALEEIRDATHIWITVGGISARRTIEMVADIAAAALAAPPRNCDNCINADEAVALAVDAGVVDCNFGAREMAEFLLAEAKGGAE